MATLYGKKMTCVGVLSNCCVVEMSVLENELNGEALFIVDFVKKHHAQRQAVASVPEGTYVSLYRLFRTKRYE